VYVCCAVTGKPAGKKKGGKKEGGKKGGEKKAKGEGGKKGGGKKGKKGKDPTVTSQLAPNPWQATGQNQVPPQQWSSHSAATHA
jgi:hypothetical protein